MADSKEKGKIRVLSGRHRGRSVPSVPSSGIRPVKSLIRERVFAWLNHLTPVDDPLVVDCFSGSGILSLEALSRGASTVYSLEAQADVVDHLSQLALQFKEPSWQAIQWRFPDALPNSLLTTLAPDIVFWDPPYQLCSVTEGLEWLSSAFSLKKGCLVYCEQDKSDTWPLDDKFITCRVAVHGRIRFGVLMFRGCGDV